MKTLKIFLVIISLMISGICISQTVKKTTTGEKSKTSIQQEPQLKQGQGTSTQSPEPKVGVGHKNGAENKDAQLQKNAGSDDKKLGVGHTNSPGTGKQEPKAEQGHASQKGDKKVVEGKAHKPADQPQLKEGHSTEPKK
jgi:hypothetical protein